MANDEKVNILVVDDLPEKLMVLETVLEDLGQNVVTARSGREALRRSLEQDYAVILLDVNMPDIDGFETAAMIRGRRQSATTPIIFITAFGDEMHTEQGYSLGAVDYILSPVMPEILRTKVGVFVDLYKKTQQVRRQAEERVALVQEQAARAAAEEATRRSGFLSEASTILVRSLDYEAIPRSLARHAVPFLGELCAVTLIGDRAHDDWRTELVQIDPNDGAASRLSVFGAPPLTILADLFRRVLETGESRFVTDVSSQLEIVASCGVESSSIDFHPHSVIVVPLHARGRTLGTIALALQSPERAYRPADFALAEDLAGRAALAIDNARLFRNIQENDRRKNEFLAMLAHELRNPLAPIRNAVEILRMSDIKDHDLQWANDVIARQVEQMVRLVDDLLDISRISGGKIHLRKEPVDVALAVARAVETSQPLITARKQELQVSLPPEPIVVDADLVRLAQVLSNLLNNAAKYTGEGGNISLMIIREDNDAVFRVRDNGIGISPEMLSQVFDLFAQASRSLDRSQGGLGIGLTLVRRLVELHGGSVQAQSDGANRGSEFVVRLPISTRPLSEREPSKNGSRMQVVAPRRILIVEDMPDVAKSLARLLRLVGHHVVTALDGRSALEELSTSTFDVVLLDIGLPGMDGFEVARAVRRQPCADSLVLVALTGYGQEDDRLRSREAGFDYHLTKPVDFDTLLGILASEPRLVAPSLAAPPSLSRA
jgi:signal transduction histidine kinase/DNA-binding response OmpR family regulator